MPISVPQVCPVMVGRDAELEVLSNLLTSARVGTSSMSLISGEAGIGKTRLQRELMAQAHEQAFRVVIGACTERDRDFPFAPFVDAIRQGIGERGFRVDKLPQSTARSLVRLLPDLEAGMPGVRNDMQDGELPERQKRQLFEAFASFFRLLAADSPLLLVLEDIHWADSSSLELVELLPRRLASEPILIVATARAEEISQGLAHCLGGLRRQRMLVDVGLSRLDNRQVDAMLDALSGARVPPALAVSIRARTDGNPFFVEELYATWRTAGHEPVVSETVREAVLHRLEDVGTAGRQVANLAAVIGKQFTMELLFACSNLGPETLLAGVEKLIERHILVEAALEREPAFAFRHALTREVIQSLSLMHQRTAIHGQVARALLARMEDGKQVSFSDLGYHFFMAHVWHSALEYAALAGDEAWTTHSTAEALVHYRRALDAAQETGNGDVARLFLVCGRCHALLGSFDAARGHLEEALRRARLDGDTAIEQSALYELSGLFSSRDYGTAQRLAGEALELARQGGDLRQEGRALNRAGNILTNLLRFDESLTLHEEALAVFQGAGDRWGVADSLDLIAMNQFLSGNVPVARLSFDRAAQMFDELDDVERFASARTSQGCYIAVLDGPCASPVTPATFYAEAEEGLQRSRDIGSTAGEAYALSCMACAAVGAGRLDEAWALARQGLAAAEEIGHQQWTVICRMTLGLILVEMLADEAALEQFVGAYDLAGLMSAAQWEQRANVWIQRCRYRLGQANQARGALDLMLLSKGPPASIGERRAALTLAEMDLAEGSADTGLGRLTHLLQGESQLLPPEVLLVQARLLHSSGGTIEADVCLQLARKRAVESGPLTLLWRIAAGRSLLWHEQNRDLSAAEAALARDEIEFLAATLPGPAERQHFLSHPEVRPWLPASRIPRTSRTAAPGGLTRREHAVAGQVAVGLTNKEIAFHLSIAEKTVEMHVSNCLGKLGFTSRTQLAGWVKDLEHASSQSQAG